MSTHRFFGARAITLFTHGLTVWCTLGRNTLNSGLAGVARWPVSSLTLCFTTWKAYSFGVASFVLTLGTFVDVFALVCLDWCNEHCNFRPMFVSILGWMQGSLTWPPGQTPAALFFCLRVSQQPPRKHPQQQLSRDKHNRQNWMVIKQMLNLHEKKAQRNTSVMLTPLQGPPSRKEHTSRAVGPTGNTLPQHFSATPFSNTFQFPQHPSSTLLCTLLSNTSAHDFSTTPFSNTFYNTLLQNSSAQFYPTHLHGTSLQDWPSTSVQQSSPALLFNTPFQHFSTLRTLFSNTSLHSQHSSHLLQHFFPASFSGTSRQHFSAALLYTTLLQHFPKLTTLFSNTSLQHSSTLLFSNTSLNSQHSSPTLLCSTPLHYSSPTLP